MTILLANYCCPHCMDERTEVEQVNGRGMQGPKPLCFLMGFYTSSLRGIWLFLVGTDMVLVIFVLYSRCSVDEGLPEPYDPPPRLSVIQGDTVLALTQLSEMLLLPLRGASQRSTTSSWFTHCVRALSPAVVGLLITVSQSKSTVTCCPGHDENFRFRLCHLCFLPPYSPLSAQWTESFSVFFSWALFVPSVCMGDRSEACLLPSMRLEQQHSKPAPLAFLRG